MADPGFCRRCGAPFDAEDRYCGRCGEPVPDVGGRAEGRSWLVALLLSIFLGYFGIDRFYLGKVGTGLLKLITGGFFGVWWLIDVILIVTGVMRDAQGRRLLRPRGV